jgi:amidohydrolase
MTATTEQQSNLLNAAKELQPKLVTMRRHIHKHPELSFCESKTGAYVAETLKSLGFTVRENVGGTGVVGEIGSGRTVIIRADMDGLPIQEANETPYRSANAGVMHACGHDAHTACGLGAAMLIAKNRPENGRVRFMFQPAEESVNADGKSGATLMIENGVTEGAEGVFALHVDPRMEMGFIGVKEGPLLAACDTFEINIKGVGTHGAYPHTGVDAIVLAAHVVQSLQTVISRRKSALDPAILTIGGIRSKTYASNIVAGEVQMTGTVRHFDPKVSQLIETEIGNACRIVESLGGSFDLEYRRDTPPLINDAKLVNIVRTLGKEILGESRVLQQGMETGGDDFSFLSDHMPGCYFILGVKIEGEQRMLHSPDFDINEEALPIGAALLAESALRYLES